MKTVIDLMIQRPRAVVGVSFTLTLVMLLLAALPSFFPSTFPTLHGVKVDTDPENMLSPAHPSRVLHQEAKAEFALYEQIVLGVVNDTHPNGVFNAQTLSNIYALTEYAKTLDGVVGPEIIAPSTIDNIEQAGLGAVSFSWMLPEAPANDAEALRVRDAMQRLPMMRGSLIDEAGQSLMLYIPIERKDQSHRISQALLQEIATFDTSAGEQYHITGLPVANDTFGKQMFVQMAISAPVAMGLIFLLMLFFFKRLTLIISPMLVALMSVILTMGALIATGNTVHIMSSMIPIFIMPIAVLDAVHILSEFYDRYPKLKDKHATIRAVMHELWWPMFFTTVTTVAGFASLIFTPIPPVQVFGGFIAMGVTLAWVLTVTFIPAYLTFLPEKSLQNFGHQHHGDDDTPRGVLKLIAYLAGQRPRAILAVSLALLGLAAYGISQIQINDNPVKWFEPNHRIRVADRVLNERFSGTYPAYLLLDAGQPDAFKQPELLNALNALQAHLEQHPNVGKTSSVTGLVQTVYREMMEGNEEYYRIPGSSRAVAQTLLTYESSHRPGDLYHFVTPDFSKAVVWLQLNAGDNREMSSVAEETLAYLQANPLPGNVKADWFGLTYINVVWQESMVAGMAESLASSFLVVVILMAILFRSPSWGLLAMVPLTLTIGLIYGVIGLIGKDYDMPVAVLSSLSLGLAVDYAIHFLARSREMQRERGSWKAALPAMFTEPGRAIARNIIVIGIGFTPLILAPLMPYQTVGILISAILLVAGLVTLLILPAILTLFDAWFFPQKRR